MDRDAAITRDDGPDNTKRTTITDAMLKILRKEFQEIDTGRKALRSFGLVVGSVLLGIGLFIFWKNGGLATGPVRWLGGIGAALILGGLVMPSALKQPYRVWMGLAVVLGFVMTRIILTVVYYAVITPTGLVLRLVGKDPLSRTWQPEADTYWLDKEYLDDSPERLERFY